MKMARDPEVRPDLINEKNKSTVPRTITTVRRSEHMVFGFLLCVACYVCVRAWPSFQKTWLVNNGVAQFPYKFLYT